VLLAEDCQSKQDYVESFATIYANVYNKQETDFSFNHELVTEFDEVFEAFIIENKMIEQNTDLLVEMQPRETTH